MSVDEKLVKTLEAAVAAMKKVVEDCKAAVKEIVDKYSGGSQHQGTGGGAFRAWVPNCSEAERKLTDLEHQLADARQGRSPSGGYKDPLSDGSPPPYLSPDSQKLYNDIKDKMDTAGQLNKWIAFGTAICAGETMGVTSVATGGSDLEDAVKAMGAIGPVLRDAIHTDVGVFLGTQKDLTRSETKYWEAVFNATSPGAKAATQ